MLLLYDAFFELEALPPFPFSMVAIIDLFLSADLTNELERIKKLALEVFLSELFVYLSDSINLEKVEKEKILHENLVIF